MGLFKKILKRDLTPEEQERKSLEEKEWAEKCYRAGENFGEKIGFRDKINSINAFGNKYPKTFFGIIFGLLFLSFGLNYMFSSSMGVFKHEAENIETITSTTNIGTTSGREYISAEARQVAEELEQLSKKVEAIIAQDTLTHQDSLDVKNMLIRMKDLHDIIK